jgi:hypothetical protein
MEHAVVSDRYKAVIPRLQPFEDSYVVQYDGGSEGIVQFRLKYSQEARDLRDLLNSEAVIDITIRPSTTTQEPQS